MGDGTETNGRSFYSYDKRFMATILDDQVTIYEAGKKNDPQRINLHGRNVSFFEWLPDRNLAILRPMAATIRPGNTVSTLPSTIQSIRTGS